MTDPLWPRRKVAVQHVVERDGLWWCTVPECGRSFDDPRAAKSHPWAAHRLRSADPKTIARAVRRRTPAAIRAAIELLKSHGYKVTRP